MHVQHWLAELYLVGKIAAAVADQNSTPNGEPKSLYRLNTAGAQRLLVSGQKAHGTYSGRLTEVAELSTEELADKGKHDDLQDQLQLIELVLPFLFKRALIRRARRAVRVGDRIRVVCTLGLVRLRRSVVRVPVTRLVVCVVGYARLLRTKLALG